MYRAAVGQRLGWVWQIREGRDDFRLRVDGRALYDIVPCFFIFVRQNAMLVKVETALALPWACVGLDWT